MKWKNLFSMPGQKKIRKKLLEHLQQPDSSIDAAQVTGGVSATPGQPDVGWIKLETTDGQKL